MPNEEPENEEYVDDNNDDDVDELDQFETALQRKQSSIWTNGGRAKDIVISKIIKYFSSLVLRQECNDEQGNFNGDFTFEKAPNSSLNVLRTRVLLRNSENYATKDFTIFIAKRKWVKSELRPLMELCADSKLDVGADRDLAMRCCKLVMVLIKRMNNKTLEILNTPLTSLSKSKKSQPSDNGDNNENDIGNSSNANNQPQDVEVKLQIARSNAIEQISALLSFKEALCTEKCIRAVTLVLFDSLQRESTTSRESSKEDLATCLSYLRRMLSIDAIHNVSPVSEIIASVGVHNRFVYYSRAMLSYIPAICADITNKYHDDWLSDILLIIHFVIKGHTAKELFQVWQENRLLTKEEFQRVSDHQAAVTATETAVQQEQQKQQQQQKNRSNGSNGVVHSTILRASQYRPQSGAAAMRADQKSSGGGLLTKLLEIEKKESMRRVNGGRDVRKRNNRFAGIYQLKECPVSADRESDEDDDERYDDGPVENNRSAAGTDEHGNPSATAAGGTSSDATTAATTATKPVIKSGPIALNKRIIYSHNNSVEAMKFPTACAKRSKKNLVFAKDDPYKELSVASASDSDAYKARVVVATMIDFICDTGGLAQLVRRVNEDLRRGEGRVGQELELVYFQVLGTLLQYQRLKMYQVKSNNDRQLQQQITQSNRSYSTASSPEWIPDMHPVIPSLDKMSFQRTMASLEKLPKEKKYREVEHPLSTFKEMICYLRIMIESDDEDHNDIAVAQLYRVFYNKSPSERLDPLPRLLSDWKVGIYPKGHVEALVELAHESMKTLEIAAARFTNRIRGHDIDGNGQHDTQNKKDKKKKVNKNRDMDVQQYISACLSFDVNEYFKRLASNHTLDMYTSLLSKYKDNKPAINHYVYKFYQRLCDYELEQNQPTPSLSQLTRYQVLMKDKRENAKQNDSAERESWNAAAADETDTDAILVVERPHLGFLLYNLQTFIVFNSLLSDSAAARDRHLIPLVTLAKFVVRNFFKAAEKNHGLFFEIMFRHAHAVDLCLDYDNVYSALSFAETSTTGGLSSQLHGNSTTADKNTKKASRKRGDAYDSDDDEEDSEMSSVPSPAAKTNGGSDAEEHSDKGRAQTAKTKVTTKRSRSEAKSSADSDDDSISVTRASVTMAVVAADDDMGDEFDENDEAFNRPATKPTRGRKPRTKTASSRAADHSDDDDDDDGDADNDDKEPTAAVSSKGKAKGKGRHVWTEDEDEFLKSLFPTYEGSSSVYTMLASELSTRDGGRDVSSDKVKTRLQVLGLIKGGKRTLQLKQSRNKLMKQNASKNKKHRNKDLDDTSDEEEEEQQVSDSSSDSQSSVEEEEKDDDEDDYEMTQPQESFTSDSTKTHGYQSSSSKKSAAVNKRKARSRSSQYKSDVRNSSRSHNRTPHALTTPSNSDTIATPRTGVAEADMDWYNQLGVSDDEKEEEEEEEEESSEDLEATQPQHAENDDIVVDDDGDSDRFDTEATQAQDFTHTLSSPSTLLASSTNPTTTFASFRSGSLEERLAATAEWDDDADEGTKENSPNHRPTLITSKNARKLTKKSKVSLSTSSTTTTTSMKDAATASDKKITKRINAEDSDDDSLFGSGAGGSENIQNVVPFGAKVKVNRNMQIDSDDE